MSERLFDPEKAAKLEDPQRSHWLPPSAVLARLGVESGWTIADVGTGTGYFARPLAGAVGDEGRVLAVDVQREMLAKLFVTLAESDAPPNIHPLLGDAVALPIGDDACDALLLANIWHEFEDRSKVAREARRVVRPGGRVAVLDWQPAEPPPGPPFDHRVGPGDARDALAAAGWFPSAPSHLGPYTWLVLAD
ncbi:MAG: methyltransferase domain-containing protein [Gemmatimonadota bacterium]|nr:methyltransferase domain-containing protein [Gemmatimonadota bacterium]